jgi:ABC-type transporter Mla maintaining outer membrane lipid asymmetry ATPase subunit MlaF
VALHVPVGVLAGFTDADDRPAGCATLEQVLADARQGRSRVLVLGGGPGIGKTALLRSTAEQANEQPGPLATPRQARITADRRSDDWRSAACHQQWASRLR